MKKFNNKLWVLYLLVATGFAACGGSDSPTDVPVEVDEAQVLVSYLEANAGYDIQGGFVIKASDVRTNVVTGASQYIIDIRSSTDFANGHIEGAVNVAFGDLLTHLAGISASSYSTIVIACYSGQTAAFATGVLRAAGHTNVKSMKWGMSSWHDDFSSPWVGGRSNIRATQFVSTSTSMGAVGELPTLSTGFDDGASILDARVASTLAAGFTPGKITNANVFLNLSGHYIINFWPPSLYASTGHVPGAIAYDPGTTPFLSTTYLKTLPTDKPVVIYCYTGQTSAYVTAYLRVLGYDARSILYGANGMIWDTMVEDGVSNAFDPDHDIYNYDYVN